MLSTSTVSKPVANIQQTFMLSKPCARDYQNSYKNDTSGVINNRFWTQKLPKYSKAFSALKSGICDHDLRYSKSKSGRVYCLKLYYHFEIHISYEEFIGSMHGNTYG